MSTTFQLEWVQPLRPCGPEDVPLSRLIGHVRILGVDFHVNAEEVEDVVLYDEEGVGEEQTATIDNGDTYVDEIQAFCGGAGMTVEIGGRNYLLAITPFQR